MEKLLKIIADVNSSVNNFIWGVPSMICIVGVGLWLLIRNRGVQFTKFGYAFKHTFGRIFNKKETSDGAISPFQAMCTALAGTVGTGNIAGVAGAIAIGGPGAVFWMWIDLRSRRAMPRRISRMYSQSSLYSCRRSRVRISNLP